METKDHWEHVYRTKEANQVSWTQSKPQTSLDFIHSFHVPKTASVIDVGGGDSKLVDYLLAEGFENISVLDISEHALQKTKQRLGSLANQVNWIIADIINFKPTQQYDVWHDRATFHFLTTQPEIDKYLNIAKATTKGYITIGTFSETGPTACSNLPVKQYTENQLTKTIANGFKKIRCEKEDHITPFNTHQNFIFCSFKRNQQLFL